jgi:ribosomal subunit interface protein
VDIIFKGRRTDVQERFRRHASAKLGKIERLDSKAIRIDVEVSTERNPRQSDRRERVELTIRSRGPVIRAEAAADDRYVALDRALAKLEARLRRLGDRRKNKHGSAGAERSTGPLPVLTETGQPVLAGLGAAGGYPNGRWPEPAFGLEPAPASRGYRQPDGRPGADDVIPIQMEGDGPLVVREKFHAAVPMSIDQALLEMELVGHDFYLFRDDTCGHPSVVYRRHGYQYGLIRLVEAAGKAGADAVGQPARRA